MLKFTSLFFLLCIVSFNTVAQTSIIPLGSSWKYLDNGTNQGSNWRAVTFQDGSWKTGNGKFGYGISDAKTAVSFGPNSKKKYITTYFRKGVSITDASAYSSYTAKVKRDDGVVVYVNGREVYRNNMPTGSISYTTQATTEATDNGNTSQSITIPGSSFTTGTNAVAVEVHLAKSNTPDMAFDLELVGNAAPPPTDKTPPTVVSISRQNPATESTSASSLIFRATFSEQVKGVDAIDFTATTVTGTVTGTVASVANVGTAGTTYDVSVNSISGEGTIRLDLKSSGTGITDVTGNAISTGYSSGQSYVIFVPDQTAPSVVSINRRDPSEETTSATSVIFRATFSEEVTGVDGNDFTITAASGSVSGTLASGAVAMAGTNGSTYDITVSSISGSGLLRLDLKSSSTGIVDKGGNSISGGYTDGQSYNIVPIADQTPPTVVSINRQDPSIETTSASALTFRSTFSEKVTGVDAADFSVTPTGTAAGSVSAIAAVGTNGSVYDVTVSAVSGEGTIRLDLKSSDTGITDAAGNVITEGYTAGQAYTILLADRTPPYMVSINRQDPSTEVTSATSVTFRADFSEQVTGVDASDFVVTAASGTVSGTLPSNAVTSVGAGGKTYDVTVSSISGSGTLRLDLKNSGTGIADEANNIIDGGYTGGQTYTIEQTPPPAGSSKVLYYEGFESGNGFTGMHLQTGTTYGFNVVGNPTYNQLKVGRWELRAGDPVVSNGTRAEVLFSEELAQEETWHSFVGYFPSADNLIDTDDEAFNQWHQGSSFGRPMLTFRTENGRFEVLRRTPDGSKTIYYIMGSIIYDQWVHFVIHIKQHLTDGIMQVWINGELKMDFKGPTMFNGPIGRWKMGIYKSSWNNGAMTNSIKRVWYVDEVKVGNAASTFESMKPVPGNNIKQLSTQSTNTQSLLADMPPPTEEQAEVFKVSPTLAKRGSTVTISTSDAAPAEMLVSDVNGRTLYTSKFTGTTALETMDLPSGMYFINLMGKKQSKKQKIIVTD